jgi:hypothetical protein
LSRVAEARRNLVRAGEALCAYRGVDADDEDVLAGAILEAEYMLRVTAFLKGK